MDTDQISGKAVERLLHKTTGVHWKEQVTNEELYGTMMRVTDKIQERRMRFTGHNIRQRGHDCQN